MPAWNNNDKAQSKPKLDVERQTREILQFYILTGNTAGNNVIQVSYNDGGGNWNNVANAGVATGQYVYLMANGFAQPGGTSGNGYPGFFASNTTVSAVSGNTITITPALFGVATAGWGIEFDTAISYPSTKPVEKTYNQDTILVTATRAANGNNAIANTGNFNAGWVHIQKKTNSDGTVRYLKETLVALANATASNTSSGNTSFGSIVTGL